MQYPRSTPAVYVRLVRDFRTREPDGVPRALIGSPENGAVPPWTQRTRAPKQASSTLFLSYPTPPHTMLRRAGQTLSPAGSARIFRCVAERFPDVFPPAGRRAFSQSASRQNYDATIRNLLIHKDTKVLCQGLTGKTVRALSECISSLYSSAIATGYFPCEGGARVRDAHGRWCLPQEGRSDPSRTSHFWHRS